MENRWGVLEKLDNLCISLQDIDTLRSRSMNMANKALTAILQYVEHCEDKDWLRAVFVLVFSESIYFLSCTQQFSIECAVLNKLQTNNLTKTEKEDLLRMVRNKAIAMHGNEVGRLIDISLHCRDLLFSGLQIE